MDDSALLPADLDRHGTTSHEIYTAGFYDGPWISASDRCSAR
ncbi:hypothetical protein [Nocardia farcinica]|nr:hypothetical protein [Nocardia farcinica]